MRSKMQKNRFCVYISDQTLEKARQWFQEDNCSSMSEFIEKAVEFYSGYVATEHNENYVSDIVLSTLKGIMDDTENRHNGSLFRIAILFSNHSSICISASLSIIKNTLHQVSRFRLFLLVYLPRRNHA